MLSNLPMIRVDDFAPALPFGTPSVRNLRSSLDEIRGLGAQGSPLSGLEQAGGIVLGAGLTGVARANGVSDPLLGVVAFALTVYGLTTDAQFLSAMGQGALAPLIAEYAGRQLVARPAEPVAEPSATAPMPRVVRGE